MPNVGNQRFPYTRAGKKAARRYGRATGQPVSNSGGGYGGGSRGQNPRNPHSIPPHPNTGKSFRPGLGGIGNAIGQPPRSLPPVPGRSAGPRKRGSLVGPGTGIGGGPRPLPKRPGGPGLAPPRGRIRGGNDDVGVLEYNRPPKGRNMGRKPGSGGSRVMGNPGMSGRPSGKMPGVGPGRRQRRKGVLGGGY